MSKRNRLKVLRNRRVRAGYPMKGNARMFGPSIIDLFKFEMVIDGRPILERQVSKLRREDGAPLYREPFKNTRHNQGYIMPRKKFLARKEGA